MHLRFNPISSKYYSSWPFTTKTWKEERKKETTRIRITKTWNKEVEETRSGVSLSFFFLTPSTFSCLSPQGSLPSHCWTLSPNNDFFPPPQFLVFSISLRWGRKIMMMSGMKPNIGTWDTNPWPATSTRRRRKKVQTRDPLLSNFLFLLLVTFLNRFVFLAVFCFQQRVFGDEETERRRRKEQKSSFCF